MSQETPIGNLSGGISEEDSKLVDSILNDINNSGNQGSSTSGSEQQGQNQPSPEQIKMMQQQQMAQQQMAMRQQQIAQQQMAQQQQHEQSKQNIMQNNSESNIVENIKLEAKNIMTIMLLCIIFNIEQIDGLFKTQSFFLTEGGGLNMQAVFVKAILIGVAFYAVKTYVL